MANTVSKIIKVAEKEVGYLEKKSNAKLDSKTANAGSANFTKYWRDLAPGMQGSYWCNCWINWIFTKAYGDKEAKKLLCTPGGWSFYTPTSSGYFKTKHQWHTTPKKGDIIYFKNSERICHVGIVYKVDSAYVYTIEGNTSSSSSDVVPNGGAVAKKKYLRNYYRIAGYGRPNYDVAPPKISKPLTRVTPKSAPKYIRWVQKKLGITVDGIYATKTGHAVAKYKKTHGFKNDDRSVVGMKMINMLAKEK